MTDRRKASRPNNRALSCDLACCCRFGCCRQESRRLRGRRRDDDAVELAKLISLVVAETPNALDELGRANSRAESYVEIRSQMAAYRIHAGDTDIAGRGLLLPLDVAVGERTNAAIPGGNDAILYPRLHIALETRVPDREVLGPVIKSRPLGGAPRCHPAANPPAFLEDRHIDAMVEQSTGAHEPGNARTDNSNSWHRFSLTAGSRA